MLSVIGLVEKLLTKTLVLLTKGENIMKRVLSILLVLAMCLCLCACGDSQEKEITTILTQGSWVSSDRGWTNKPSNTWTQIYGNYKLTFFDDGSYCSEYTVTNIGAFDGTEQERYTGKWSINGNTITLHGALSDTVLTYTEDHVLHGPKADGYTYTHVH